MPSNSILKPHECTFCVCSIYWWLWLNWVELLNCCCSWGLQALYPVIQRLMLCFAPQAATRPRSIQTYSKNSAPFAAASCLCQTDGERLKRSPAECLRLVWSHCWLVVHPPGAQKRSYSSGYSSAWLNIGLTEKTIKVTRCVLVSYKVGTYTHWDFCLYYLRACAIKVHTVKINKALKVLRENVFRQWIKRDLAKTLNTCVNRFNNMQM